MSENKAFEKLKGTHSCHDSGLKCVDCNEQICPKCMVQCAVGNRCKKCTTRFTSHVLLVTPKVLVKLLAVSMALGFAWGYAQPHLSMMGFYGYFIQFFAAWFLGKTFLHRAASYKLGGRVTAVALVGLLLGLAIGPVQQEFLNALAIYGLPVQDGGDQTELGRVIVGVAIFLIGALMPFLRK